MSVVETQSLYTCKKRSAERCELKNNISVGKNFNYITVTILMGKINYTFKNSSR